MANKKISTARPVYLDMTGKEFKTLIERVTQDGKVNTLPELFELLGSLPDDMTLEEYIHQQAVDAAAAASEEAVKGVLEEQTATDDDIDELFPDLPPLPGDDDEGDGD